ncbi:hypothetical protein BIY37_04710 [Candidatus Brocadia sapporoensis]|uniref:Uncharacterized protein n=1 Tax=Candidatus Brocadia sapporoensis TaxID=392547 RepID=A0A1V6M185_9BACT|nr:hypothetical protein [Candidatus Brocadia sapporoensis]MDG6005536.1 hypothetical protein [Candidatus Brocadia sp.]OQD46125.1 hypothetical protein BIY37_04710 [Candidatus Brocadia sapporoensis]GJQ23588.1 MAG: hypothetical protein HBSAPP01_13780 [Candidatus Brocadia sapporoensis]
MNRDRIFKQGLIAHKKDRLAELEIKADRCRKDINIYLFSYEGIKGMEFDKARQAFEDLSCAVDEYKVLREEMRRIENEL